MASEKKRTIKVDYLARVEGEGALHLTFKGREVDRAELRIFEPPRFFEAFLRGRSFMEASDITARICGICPVAYQMSAVHAMEDVFGVRLDGPLRDLRRLLYCGEWLESHILHVYMLHAPDFLGYESAIDLAKDVPGVVERGLAMKKAGNAIVQAVGGREIHPINVRTGGFYKAPARRDLLALVDDLERARDAAEETVRFVAGLEFPDFERPYEFVALRHPDEYAMNEGRLVSNQGLDIAIQDYDDHFEEIHVEHSNALHGRLRARGNYFVGPLARFNLNHGQLSERARAAAQAVGFEAPCHNPFKSIIARSVEVLYAFDEALRLIQDYRPPERPAVDLPVRAGTGHGCTEAPRGILYHRYRLAEDGSIEAATIIPPTSQNQPTIEADLRDFATRWVDLPDDQLQWKCEQSIRNYDPCISCATHFLDLTVERS